MSDVYEINVVKTQFREAHEAGDVERLVEVFDADGFTDMSHEEPNSYRRGANDAVRQRAIALFREYSVKMSVIVIEVIVSGNTAYDYGWHEFTLSPKGQGEPIRRRERYFEVWKKKASGAWKISFYITNADVKEKLASSESHWFLSEELSSRPS